MSSQLAKRKLAAASFAVISGSLFGGAGHALAYDYTSDLVFFSEKQSIWGTGNAAVSINKQNEFLGAQWNKAATVSAGNWVDGNGFKLDAATSGRIGIEYDLKIDSGSIDTRLPFDVRISTPNANQMTVGQNYFVGTNATFRQDEATFLSRSPTFQFGADLVFDLKASLGGQASVDLFFFDKQVAFGPKTLVDVSTSTELIAINRDNDGAIRILPILFDAASQAKDTYDAAEATRELKQEVDSVSGRREKVKIALKKVGVSFSLESPLEASIRLPYIEMEGEAHATNGNKITKSDKDGFAEFSFDLDRIANMIAPATVPPMTVNADLDLVVGGIQASATLIDLDFNPTVNLTQDATVEQKGVDINFNFGRQVLVGVADANGNLLEAQSLRSSITIDAGEQLVVNHDGQDINLTPTYTVAAELQNQFGLSISSELAFKALEASVSASLFGFEVGGFTLGPAFETGIQFPDVGLGNLFDKTFALQGFNTITGPTIFISDKAAEFTGINGTAWETANNWKVGAQVGITPDAGRSAVILGGTSFNPNAVVLSTANAAVDNLSLEQHSNLQILGRVLEVNGNVYNQGIIATNAAGEIRFVEDDDGLHAIQGGRISLGGTLTMKNVADVSNNQPWLSFVGATLESTSQTATIQLTDGPGRLFLANGSTLRADFGSKLNVITNTTTGFDIIGAGVQTSRIIADNNSTIDLRFSSIYANVPVAVTADALKTGGIVGMLELAAGNGSEVRLFSTANAGGYSFAKSVGQTRFLTNGTGRIRNGGELELWAMINDGNFVADTSLGSSVTTRFVNRGNLPVVNNGKMTFGSTSNQLLTNRIQSTDAIIEGTGEWVLAGDTVNPVVVTSATGGSSTLTNGIDHTIRGRGNLGDGKLAIINRGKIIGDSSVGGGGPLDLRPSAGQLSNTETGLIQAAAGSRVVLRTGTLDNAGTVEAKHTGSFEMDAGTNSNNLFYTSGVNTATLQGGTWRTETQGNILLRTTNAGTTFNNAANIELHNYRNFTATDGISITDGTNTRNIRAYGRFNNLAIGTLALSGASLFETADLNNRGTIDLANSTVRGVTNESTGVIAGSGEVQLKQTSANTAQNRGTILAMPGGGFSQLSITADAGVTTLDNQGTIGAIGADLFLGSLLLPSTSAGSMSSGKWIVDGTDAAARIVVNINNSYLTNVVGAEITLSGAQASFQSRSGQAIKDFRETLTTISSGGKVTVDGTSSQNFTNALTVFSGGQLQVTNGGTINSPTFNIYGKMSGNGTLGGGTMIVQSTGTVAAEGGMLGFGGFVQNNGKLDAILPGAVLNPTNATISGGQINIGHKAAGLFGTGTINATSINNVGIVAAGSGTLRFEGSGSFTNTGEITTRQNGTIELAGASLNNTGGLISAKDTGGLDLQSDGGGVGGTIKMRGTTVSGGDLLVYGANSRLEGYGTFNNVDLDVVNATVTANFSNQTLTLAPDVAIPAIVSNSNVKAEGGKLKLSGGTFEAVGTTFTANGSTSSIELNNTTVKAGKYKTINGGSILVTGNSTLTGGMNQGTLTVNPAQTLNIFGAVDNRGGTINAIGRIDLPAADLIGGNVNVNNGGSVNVTGKSGMRGANFAVKAGGALFVSSGSNFTVDNSVDGQTLSGSFANQGNVTVAGTMTVSNQLMTNSAVVQILSGGNLAVSTFTQTGGETRINGRMSAGTFNLQGGNLYGSGRLTGSLRVTGGVVQPGNSPGTLVVEQDFVLGDGGTLNMQIEDLSTFDKIVSENGDIHLGGDLVIDMIITEAIGELFTNEPVTFDMFDFPAGRSIIVDETFSVRGTGAGLIEDFSIDLNTGEVTFTAVVPEPTTIGVLAVAGFTLGRRRRR